MIRENPSNEVRDEELFQYSYEEDNDNNSDEEEEKKDKLTDKVPMPFNTNKIGDKPSFLR